MPNETDTIIVGDALETLRGMAAALEAGVELPGAGARVIDLNGAG